MLDVLRKRKRSWLVLLLLGVGVLAFVMVGVGPQGGQDQVVTIAQVNGEEITYTELERDYYRMLQTYRQLAGGRLSPADIEALNLRGQLLEELIDQRLLLQAARGLGLRVTDQELAEGITGNPAFHAGGRFDKDVYERALRGQGLTPGEFEARQREALVIRKLQDLVQHSIPVTAAEVEERYRLDNEEIALDFVRFRTEDFLRDVTIEDEEIQEYYDRNGPLLREPLKVRATYAAYTVDRFAADVQVSGEDVQAYYDVYRDRRFRRPEGVKFSQIFLPAPAQEVTPEAQETKEEARKILEDVRKQAEDGADFAELARRHSRDENAAQGGDMGFVGRGQLTPPLDTALFALAENEVSGVVESTLGLHLLKAVEKREAGFVELAEVRGEIVETLKRERGGARAARAAEEDRERVLDGATLADAASKRGVGLSETRLFGPGESLDEIGDLDEFYRVALSLRPDRIGPVVSASDALYLLQVSERVEPAVPPLEEVTDKVREMLTRRKARDLARSRADALLAELEESPDLGKVAAGRGLTVEDTGLFPRKQAEIPDIGFLSLPLGRLTLSRERPVAESAYVHDDSVYVLVLRKTVEADLAGLAGEREDLTRRVREEKRQRAFRQLIEHLKANAEIEIHPEFI